MGKTLLILVDQADKVPTLVAEEIARLLDKGGSYVCILATRPYPTAPDPWDIPGGIVAGDDYDLFTLGRSPRSDQWEDFLLRALAQHTSSAALTQLISKGDSLVCLAGGSVRTALQIAQRLEQTLVGSPVDQAWQSAVEMTADQEVTLARNVISGYCGSTPAFIKSIRDLSFTSMQAISTKLAPVVMRIVRDASGQGSLFGPLPESGQALLRVASKAGIFAPTSEQPWIPDLILDEYQVSPLLLVAGGDLANHPFSRQNVYFDAQASEIARWASPPGFGPQKRARKARVFVSYWMSRGDSQKLFRNVLEEQMGSEIDILVGRAQGSGSWVQAILEKMRRSDAVVVDLSIPRRDVYVELGLAMGLTKATLLAAKGEEERARVPAWLQHRHIYQFDSDDRLAELFVEIRRLASKVTNRSERWIEDSNGVAIKYSVSSRVIGAIGGPSFVAGIWQGRGDVAAAEANLEVRSANASDQNNPDALYDCIKVAREASTLVLYFDGSESDYACCVAGGVLAAQPRISVQNTHFARRIVCVLDEAVGPDEIPGIVRRFPGTKIVTAPEFGETIRSRIAEHTQFRERMKKVISGQP